MLHRKVKFYIDKVAPFITNDYQLSSTIIKTFILSVFHFSLIVMIVIVHVIFLSFVPYLLLAYNKICHTHVIKTIKEGYFYVPLLYYIM